MDAPPRSKPRIVQIVPYSSPVVGGITTYVLGLKEALESRGAEVIILTREGDGGPGVLRGPTDIPTFVRWCRRQLSELNPDAVHAHSHWYCLAGALSRVGRPLVRPLVFTVHTLFEPKSLVRVWAIGRLLRRVDVVTCVSDSARERLVRKFRRLKRVAVINPGTSVPDGFSGSSELDFNEPASFRVIAVSVLSWREKVAGITLLLQAMRGLSKDLPHVSLAIVGEGEFRSELESEAGRLGIADQVSFVGRVPNAVSYIAKSDVLCHISFKEAFPQVVLEALSVCVPVIALDGIVDDMPGASSETGVVRVKADAQSIRSALLSLALDPVRRRSMGQAGMRYVVERFSWRSQSARFWELYALA